MPNQSYPEKQAINYASLLKKMANSDPITVTCQGDSMTYGQDTTSNDRRPAKSDSTCDQTNEYSNHEQAGKTYPESLQEYCNKMFGKSIVTIINRGYSGDWADISKKRWNSNPNADLHFVMLGTNDSSTASHVPTEVQQNITKYIEDMISLIKQIIDFKSAVVLLTPPKHGNETNLVRIAYRKALKLVGDQFHIPVIDTSDFLKTYPYELVQSDDIHYNSKGYTILGSKIAGILASIGSIYNPLKLNPNNIIVPSFDDYGITFSQNCPQSVTLEEHEMAPFGIGSSYSKRLMFHMYSNTRMTFSFMANDDNLVITPLFKMSDSDAELNLEIDFSIELKGFISPHEFERNGRFTTSTTKLTNQLSYKGNVSRIIIINEDNSIKLSNSLHLPRKGFYSISIENPSPADGVFVYGFHISKYN